MCILQAHVVPSNFCFHSVSQWFVNWLIWNCGLLEVIQTWGYWTNYMLYCMRCCKLFAVLCFRLLNQLHLNLPISLHEYFKYLLATHGRKDHDRVIFYFKLTCNLEDNITHLESKYTGHLSSSGWHSHIFSQHKSKEKLDETSLCCPAVAILTSRRYCSHLYCTAYSQRKQSGGLKIKPNGVIKTRSAPRQTDSLCFFTVLLA